MISGIVDREIIDALIWGDVDSELIEAKIPLSISGDVRTSAKELVWNLFVGFLYFIHHRSGLMPELSGGEKECSGMLKESVADRSSWAEFMVNVDPMPIPYSFKQFTSKKGDSHTICIMLDTFSLFECGKILNETKLEGDSKFSFSEMSKEFDVHGKGLPEMLSYFQSLDDAKWADAHTMVLRPSKLAEYLCMLDDELGSLLEYPEKIVRKEKPEKMAMIDHTHCFSSMGKGGCNEENFRELLKEHSMEIPNVKFLTFYEYIQDKLDHRIEKEWADIRDRYITKHKEVLQSSIPTLEENPFRPAKGYLVNAKERLDGGKYIESIIQSSKAMEEILQVLAGPAGQSGVMHKNMSIVMDDYEDLRKHKTHLDFIKATRNKLVHASGVDECDESAAKFALESMDRFLTDVTSRLR